MTEQSEKNTVIHRTHLQTPLGGMYACATRKGICMLAFTDFKEIEKMFAETCRILNARFQEAENEHLKLLRYELTAYFKGELRNFSVPVILPGTDFEQKVWRELMKIPFGKTISYKQQAISFGNVPAIRAIAAANGRNKISIVVPCHRVIATDGKLAGYSGGLDRKRKLLELEGIVAVQNTFSFD